MWWLVFVFAAGLLTNPCRGCGFTTHDTIAHRARTSFYADPTFAPILDAFPEALQGGAPFPDYLYTCGSNHSDGEYAHWSPFQANAANYIRSQSRPWTNSTQQLVAFMMGVCSHYIADISWHGLLTSPHGYGFIETLGIADYNCTGQLCSVAHTAADKGGEFIAATYADLDFAKPLHWYVPSKQLVDIFELGGVSVNASSIEECHLLFAAGELAIKALGFVMKGLETNQSPFLQEEYFTFNFGGVDDMAVWTSRIWHRFTSWVTNGVPPGPPSLDTPAIRRPSPALSRLRHVLAPGLTTAVTAVGATHGQGVDIMSSVDIGKAAALLAAHLRKSPQALAAVGDALGLDASRLLGALQAAAGPNNAGGALPAVAPGALLAGDAPFMYLGCDIAVGKFNNATVDVAAGALGAGTSSSPQHGAVWLANTSAAHSVVLPQADEARTTYARFGASVAALDFNLDGVDDLVVAAPSSGWQWDTVAATPEFRYTGAVFVYFGSATAWPPRVPDVVVSDPGANMTALGTKLDAVDHDGDGHADLVIGAPYSRGGTADGIQRGSSFVFLSGSHRVTGAAVNTSSADVVTHGGSDFEWCGYAVASVPGVPSVFLTSAPLFRNVANGTTVGRVVGTVSSGSSFTLEGNVFTGKFGAALAVDAHGEFVAVAAPTAGVVFLLSGSALRGATGAHVAPSLPGLVAQLTVGDSPARHRFGWALAFAGPSLFVSAPFYSTTGAEVSRAGNAVGAVYRYDAPARGGQPSWTLLGTSHGSRLGSALAVLGNTTLAVGSPFAGGAAGGMSGRVDVYPIRS